MSRLIFIVALALIGCASEPRMESRSEPYVEFRPASFEPSDASKAMAAPDSERPVYVSADVLLTEADFTSASVTEDADGRRAVQVRLSDAGADRFFNYTRHHIGEPIAIFIDGELFSAPVVVTALRNTSIITGGREGLTEARARQIVSAVDRK